MDARLAVVFAGTPAFALPSLEAIAGSRHRIVAVLTQPYMESGLDQGFQDLPESEHARIDRLNELLAEAVSLRPGVARLIDLRGWMAAQPGGELDPASRPDGIHFTDAYSATVASWLGPQLVAIGRGGA